MKARTIPPPRWGRPVGAPTLSARLLLDPPLEDVVDGAERARREVLKVLLRDRQHIVRVAEVVRLVLVEDLVERLVGLLASRGRAVTVRWVARVLDRLVHRGVLEERESESSHVLGRVRDLARVPDDVRVGIPTKAPTDDGRLDRLVARRELGHEALERLGLRDGVDAELLVLVGGDLRERLTLGVARVGRDREVELLAVLVDE